MRRQTTGVSRVYDVAEAYALAFSYRDIPAEVDALLGWASLLTARPMASVLELAAGPAEHAREFAGRGLRATALDLSHAMTDYASAQAELIGVPLRVVTADMCDFAIEERFDLAIMMVDSIAHVLDTASLDAHFRCVAAHLNDSGCYIIEASHPNDSLGGQALTQTAWTQTGEGESVSMRWGEPGDTTDPNSGVTSVTVTITHHEDGQDPVVIRDVVPEHAWSREAIADSVARAGGLEIRAWYGSFAGVALDDDAAWRMIAILQRC
jgi:Methyltransferase domain